MRSSVATVRCATSTWSSTSPHPGPVWLSRAAPSASSRPYGSSPAARTRCARPRSTSRALLPRCCSRSRPATCARSSSRPSWARPPSPSDPYDHRIVELLTLTDGGQTAQSIADRLAAWLGEAKQSLDLALYDVRLPGAVGDAVADAIRAAAARGVQGRIAFNEAHPGRAEDSPPPRTQPTILETLGVPLRAIPGEPDLMHHKYVVRDQAAVWTGSTNWTLDSWTRMENLVVRIEDPTVAAAYARDFGELWRRGEVDGTGAFEAPVASGVRPWFCPGRGEELGERIGAAIARAKRRVRIASPVITAGPVLNAL